MSTSEGIRWAHNVARDAIKAFTDLIPDQGWSVVKTSALNFKPIPEAWVRDHLAKLGLDPDIPQVQYRSEMPTIS